MENLLQMLHFSNILKIIQTFTTFLTAENFLYILRKNRKYCYVLKIACVENALR